MSVAALIPNPGVAVVLTNSTTADITYVDSPVTQRVDTYLTTLSVFLNGAPLLSQSFTSSFTDSAVQAAVVHTDAMLSADGAIVGPPVVQSLVSTLQSEVVLAPPTYDCLTVPFSSLTGTANSVRTIFGPATIATGACMQDTFIVLSAQTDVDVNTLLFYTIFDSTLTTGTFLTTSTYDIFATTSSVSVPEPATLPLLFVGLVGLLWVIRCGPSRTLS